MMDKEFEEALAREWGEYCKRGAATVDAIEDNTQELAFAKGFYRGYKEAISSIWHSVDETPEYPCDILYVTNVLNIFLHKYMENGRPIDHDTPYFRNITNGKCWCYINDLLPKSE